MIEWNNNLNRISSLAESFASSAIVTKKGNFDPTEFKIWTCSAATYNISRNYQDNKNWKNRMIVEL